jgi:hypothetical protein
VTPRKHKDFPKNLNAEKQRCNGAKNSLVRRTDGTLLSVRRESANLREFSLIFFGRERHSRRLAKISGFPARHFARQQGF